MKWLNSGWKRWERRKESRETLSSSSGNHEDRIVLTLAVSKAAGWKKKGRDPNSLGANFLIVSRERKAVSIRRV